MVKGIGLENRRALPFMGSNPIPFDRGRVTGPDDGIGRRTWFRPRVLGVQVSLGVNFLRKTGVYSSMVE